MTKVKVLRTFAYSPDGLIVVTWPAGSVQSVDDVALDIMIAEGACEIVEIKAFTGAPENKAKRPRKARK